LNEKRRGLNKLFQRKQVRIELIEPPKTQPPSEELVADLLSIVTVFSGRLYGSRARKVRSCVSKAIQDCLQAEETDGTDSQNNQTPAGSL
jgi:putative resolvase